MLSVLLRGEREERRFARKYVRPRSDVVDLGAGKLLTGREALGRLLPGTRYVGLEMQADLLAEARRVALSVASPGVHVCLVHGAICSTREAVGVWSPGSWEGCATTTGDTVPCFTLARLLDEYGIRDGYSLLMDIEGAECDVIANDEKALQRASFILVELHDGSPHSINPWACKASESLVRLQALGFTVIHRGRGEVYALEKTQD
jgi:FkbM family methyltransferase